MESRLPPGHDVDPHFTPRYEPWDQRVCLVPDGDLFEALHAGRASIVTDPIDTFTENGLRLASGAELDADLIVTARASTCWHWEARGSRSTVARSISRKPWTTRA